MNPDDKTGLEVLFSISAALFALGFWILRRETAPRKWPQTTGTIVTSGNESQSVGQGRREVTPVIEYEFNYQGQSCKTSHWRFGNYTMGNEISAGAVTSRYPVGSSVTVFVNTRHPEKSVLESKASGLCLVPFGFGLLFVAIAILILLQVTTNFMSHP
jgi:Protein of unknown function (DUF3592)